jgi:ElaB/YqjD/DUF883 family membrane-anchored ribosome-binding protein
MQNRMFPAQAQRRLPPPHKPSCRKGWMQHTVERVEDWIAAHPAAALAAGVALGVTLGWLIKRKS